jgi:hypothetical protein
MTDTPEYTLREAAALLGCAWTTLRDKCTRGEVPHHRRHRVKGIYFTEADLDEIRASHIRRPGRRPSHSPAADGRSHGTRADADELTAALAALPLPMRTRQDR